MQKEKKVLSGGKIAGGNPEHERVKCCYPIMSLKHKLF